MSHMMLFARWRDIWGAGRTEPGGMGVCPRAGPVHGQPCEAAQHVARVWATAREREREKASGKIEGEKERAGDGEHPPPPAAFDPSGCFRAWRHSQGAFYSPGHAEEGGRSGKVREDRRKERGQREGERGQSQIHI